MIKTKNRTLILFLSILTLLILGIIIYSLFSEPSNDTGSSDKIIVAASVLPQKEFIEKVGGDRVQVIIMVPKGADPHTYEPQPSKLRELSQAKLYFEVGSGIEFELNWMDKIRSLNSQMEIINTSEGINLIPNQENQSNENESNLESASDPHVWVSPKNAMKMVENTYQGLVKIDPSHKEYYLKNKEDYLKELQELDKNITQSLKNENSANQTRTILVYHPAWGYLCRDYGLQQIAIQHNGKEPSAQLIAQIIKESKNKNVKAIFVSPQFSTKNAEMIAKEIGAKTVVIDPLAPDYIQNMEKVVKAFQNSAN